jgi:hypothetical protein
MPGVYGVVASTQASRDWAAAVSGDGVPPRLALATFKYKSRRSRNAHDGLVLSGAAWSFAALTLSRESGSQLTGAPVISESFRRRQELWRFR